MRDLRGRLNRLDRAVPRPRDSWAGWRAGWREFWRWLVGVYGAGEVPENPTRCPTEAEMEAMLDEVYRVG